MRGRKRSRGDKLVPSFLAQGPPCHPTAMPPHGYATNGHATPGPCHGSAKGTRMNGDGGSKDMIVTQ
jgi:hypothetical protein